MIWIFSNVRIAAEVAPTVAPEDTLIFLNKAINAPLYAGHRRRMCFRRSPDANYGADVPDCANFFCFVGKSDCTIPAHIMAKIRAGYDYNYPIEPGKVRCPTTGYIVTRYAQLRKPCETITLVNFGFAVENSTYRCPWHNWRFEARELSGLTHVYTYNKEKNGNQQ